MSGAIEQLPDNPLLAVEESFGLQEVLCDRLEQIADSLPGNADFSLVSSTLVLLKHELPLCILDEEHGLYPLLEARAKRKDNIAELMLRLRRENSTDESYAAELSEQLEVLQSGERREEMERLGYMLRSFFESRRRHVAWAKAILLPLTHKRLGPQDCEVLAARMLEHRGRHLHAEKH